MNINTTRNNSSSKKVGGVNKNINNNNIKFFKSNRNFNTKRLIVFLSDNNKRKIVIKNNKKKNIKNININNNNKYNIMKYNNNNINNNSNGNGNSNNDNNNYVVVQNNTNYGSPVVGSLLNSVNLSAAAALVPETFSVSNYDDMIDFNSVPSENVLNAPTNYTSYLIGLYNTNEQLYSCSSKNTIDADLNNYGSMFELINGSNKNSNSMSPLIRSSNQTVPTL